VAVGMLVFDFYLPDRPQTYVWFAVSTLLSVLVCATCLYVIALTAFWLLDLRGVTMMWMFAAGAGSGLYFPLPFLPGGVETVLWLTTPFPALMQAPLDVLVERGSAAALIGGQLAWLVVVFTVARLVQRRALRRLVIQGG
jgi:ABC-2 type transport system permease protein